MSASEIISSQVNASNFNAVSTLDLYPLRFRPITPPGRVWTPNLLRGAFGSVLKRLDSDAYRRFFAPTARTFLPVESTGKRPSGLSDLPRPFVFRLSDGDVGLNLFLSSAVDLVLGVMRELDLELAARPTILCLPLAAQDPGSASDCAERLRIRFLTPTELKGAGEPHAGAMFDPAFGSLLARVRDRISTLRALYGPGPLDLDFRAFGERAARVRMTRCELQTVEEERLSRRTGRRHSLGGFTGVAEYEGAVAEFIPYLEAARWTGVGRQTVWGKGEIGVERLHD
jgi:hypothetical protein